MQTMRAVARQPDFAAPAFPQIFGGEIQGQCPSSCAIPITITSVKNLGRSAGDGFRIEVKWTVGNPPAGFQPPPQALVGVDVMLPNGKVRKGSGTSNLFAHVTVVTTDGRSDDANPKSFRVTVAANAGPNKSVALMNVTGAKVLRSLLGGGHEIEVKWDDSKLASCNLCRLFDVRVVATLQDGKTRDGDSQPPISARRTVVTARGFITDGNVKSITATVKPINCNDLFCVAAKSGSF